MKLQNSYAIFNRTRVKVVTQLRIQNRWVISTLFLIGAIILLFGIMYYRSIKTVDLSNYTVNDIGLNDHFNQKGYIINKKIKLDRFKFYNDEKHKDLTVKVKNKKQNVPALPLIRQKKCAIAKTPSRSEYHFERERHAECSPGDDFGRGHYPAQQIEGSSG